jgi:peroxiredoxin
MVANMLRRYIVPGVLFLAFAVGMMATGCTPSAGSGHRVGNQAPDFSLTDLDGNTVSLTDFRGQGVLLNFWASWCGPCRTEMPYLQEIHEQWSYLGIAVLAVNLEESQTTVNNFVTDNNLTFPVLLDTQAEVAKMYSISAIPTTVFIDKDGIITERKVGSFPNRESIEPSLGEIMPRS